MAATLSSGPASSKHCSIVRAQQSPIPSILSASTKTAFHGLSLVDRRWVASASHLRLRGSGQRRLLQVNARTAGAAKNIEVEVDKPLGLTLGQKSGGGVVITSVESGGNAARAGLKAGDQVLYTSSFFGDELWPADKAGIHQDSHPGKARLCLLCSKQDWSARSFGERINIDWLVVTLAIRLRTNRSWAP